MVTSRMLSMLVAVVILAALMVGCGGSDIVKDISAEERFKHAKELFDDEDYLEAINEFTVITLQNQGSTYASDAQYFLAESRFRRGEYLLSAFEYQVLRRNYPASSRVADAQFKIGLSYYNLSPRSPLDQQYTRKAIDEFQAFVEYFPKDSLVGEATAKVRELTTRLAKKTYETARLYVAMEYYRAALLSFEDVIDRYHDTEFAPLAYEGKVDLLMSRNHYREASEEITRFLNRYPNSVLKSRFEELKAKADNEVKKGNNVESGPAPRPQLPTEVPQL